MNANDQSNQGPKTEIGTENPNGPESEDIDGGNVRTDVISPQEGASDDESDEPPVSPSNLPLNGKILGDCRNSFLALFLCFLSIFLFLKSKFSKFK
jgi:hypothetical protein